MSDIKMFQLQANGVRELHGASMAVEKSLQNLIEQHLDTFLGVRFLASEYSTGRTHGGRIDTLGIDENNRPVIIEYKRAVNESVINQGLFYLNWLMDHKAEFKLLVLDHIGRAQADAIEWRSPRLLCIAGDFTKYDEQAIQQIPRNIELIRYRRYGDELLLLELVNATAPEPTPLETDAGATGAKTSRMALDRLANASVSLRDRYHALDAFLLALGDDVQKSPLKLYVAYKRLKNFACVEIHPQSQRISVFAKVDPDSISLEPGFTRDVRNVGHFGTGDLEITIDSDDDLERAQPLIRKSYEAS